MREYQRVLEKMIEERTEQVNHLLLNTIQALIHSIEAKDPFTKGHSARVTWLSQQLGKTSGCQIHDLELLQIGGMFHDLGKIGIRENVLLKNGALTRSEYDHIKTHPEIGVRILQPLAELKEILPIVLHHHEHYDGSGYPAGLQGEEIPLLARVISIADAYDAMISARPYRKALPMHEAIRRLKAGAGTQFDAHLIDLFLSIIQSNDFCQRFESEPDLSMPLIRQDNTIMNRLPSISQGPQTLRIC
jgi:HD-GYP domain-containing protein (c-di-GMP phosphodiesterase class II)